MSVSLADLHGAAQPQRVRDLWRQEELGGCKTCCCGRCPGTVCSCCVCGSPTDRYRLETASPAGLPRRCTRKRGSEMLFLRPLTLALLVLGAAPALAAAPADRQIDLAGAWAFRLDPDDAGRDDALVHREALPERISLPGSLQEQGFGDEVSVDTPWTGGIVDRSWFESPRVRAVPPTGQRQGAVLAPARPALRRRGLVPARGRDPRRLARQADRPVAGAVATGRPTRLGRRARRSAAGTACRRPTSTTCRTS